LMRSKTTLRKSSTDFCALFLSRSAAVWAFFAASACPSAEILALLVAYASFKPRTTHNHNARGGGG